MIKEEKSISKDKEQKEITVFLNLMSQVFRDLSQDADMSSKLSELNIESEFSTVVKNALSDPLAASHNSLLLFEKAIKEIVHKLVSLYLSSYKDKFEQIYLVNDENPELHYAIVLKENQDKAFLHTFLNEYDKIIVSHRVPLIIQDIPASLRNEFLKEVEKGKFELVAA